MEIAVIGSGASGLVSAIESAKLGNNVTVLERLNDFGKKILVTGNGKCNYWNEDFSNKHFYSSNYSFIKEVNTEENRKAVLKFFKNIGIVPTIKNGYYYPMSKEASSIRNALLEKAKDNNVKFINDANVNTINKIDNKFYIKYKNKKLVVDKVIIATGSKSYYKEDAIGYSLCKKLGHNIIKVMPSLVQLVGDEPFFKEWKGGRNNSVVSILVDNKKIKEETGEIMLTDYGVSGICIFNLSGIASRALNENKKVEININFIPEIKDANSFFDKRETILKNRSLDEFLEGIINYKLANIIIKRCHLSKSNTWSNLNKQEKNNIIENLTNFKLNIKSTEDFSKSQVCTGGVDTSEINSKTMESKKCKGLFIVGEILDVDGDCGGYNLGFAWLSGLLAGRSVNSD